MIVRYTELMQDFGPHHALVLANGEPFYRLIRHNQETQDLRRAWPIVANILYDTAQDLFKSHGVYRVTCDETTNAPDVVEAGKVAFHIELRFPPRVDFWSGRFVCAAIPPSPGQDSYLSVEYTNRVGR